MKRIICFFVVAIMLLSTTTYAATYYDINVEGLSATEKREVVEWLEDQGFEYDVESYSSSSNDEKVIIVEKLTTSEKNTLVNWLKNRDYDYTTKTKNGYYYVTIEYTSSTKSKLVNYLDDKGWYDGSSKTSSRGEAYLVANGVLWYADGDEIEKVNTIYSPEYIWFTKDGGIAYINESKKGMHIEDLDEPTESKQIAKSVKGVKTNASGYATHFKGSGSTAIKIEAEDDFDNDKVTVYIVKNNILYSLSSKNELDKLKSLKSVSSTYSNSNVNIGFSEWGDLVLIDSTGVCWFNEKINNTNKFELLKDQDGYSVKAKYFTASSGIIKTVALTGGGIVKLEDD